MDAEIKHHMKINGITPNVLVLPPKAGIYVSMVPPSETVYSERGPGAHEALTTDRTGITTFRGNKVFEAQSFDVDFQHDFIDLTSRPRMCGEYFVIPGTTAPHDIMTTIGRIMDILVDKPIAATMPRYDQTRPEVGGTLAMTADGSIGQLLSTVAAAVNQEPFIHIYSADKDDWVKITYSQANLNALNASTDVDAQGRMMDKIKEALNKVHKKYEELGKTKVALQGTPRAKKDMASKFVAGLEGREYAGAQRAQGQGAANKTQLTKMLETFVETSPG